MKINFLHWDDENIEHITLHGLSPVDVEDICFGKHISFIGRQKRYILYGKAENDLMLMVVLERIHGDNFRPVTARVMTDKEKRIYRKRIGE